MEQAVIIKANNFGLLIILHPEMEFEKLKQAVGEKFKESANFFGSAMMAISFEGRHISAEEEDALITEILKYSSFKISCVIDNNPEKERLFMEHINHYEMTQDLSMAKIYRGNLRSGKLLEFDTGVIILGDINPGAKVRARGNIIVLGSLKGEAESGTDGNDSSFIIALDMKPIQLRIGTKMARSSDNAPKSHEKSIIPQIAFVENDNIYMENLDKKTIESLYLPE